MAENKDILLDHESDGIQEYDNPFPEWFMWLLYGTIIFAILYVFYYGFNYGDSIQSGYRAQLVDDYKSIQDYYAAHPVVPPTSEALLAAAVDEQTLAVGKDQFIKTCAACHGDKAQGLIGPNLTDPFWIHGGQVVQIWTTITKGVPAKGMPSWGRAFKPEVINALAAYVRSLQGSDPPDARAPQGTPVEMEPLPKPAP